MVVRAGENIAIGIDIGKKSKISSKYRIEKKAGIAHPYETYNQNIVYFIFGIWQRNLQHMSKTPSWNVAKFVVLKHFGWDVLHKESSAPFLLTLYMLKSVFY